MRLKRPSSELMVYLLLLFGSITAISLLDFYKARFQIAETKAKDFYLPPPKSLKFLTFGYDEAVADSLWIRLLQDLEVCGKNTITEKEYREKYVRDNFRRWQEEVQGQYKSEVARQENINVDKSLSAEPLEKKVCVKGWSFRLLDAITELAPKFRIPYASGAVSLSVLVNDHIGAKIIFDKAVKQFPNDWPILYRAAYHYLYELRDLQTAAKLLRLAGERGAPTWVKSLASRLYTRSGRILLGLSTLKEYYQTIENPELKKKVAARIARLESHLKNQ